MFKFKGDAVKSQKMAGTKLMNISAVTVAVLGLASLINNILLFKDTVSQYVAQGYPSGEVLKYMIPSQLLPGLLEILAVYGGIAMILWAAGIINQNLASCGCTIADQEPATAETLQDTSAEADMNAEDNNFLDE